MPTEDMPFGYGRTLRLPDAMRSELRVPLGRLVTRQEFRRQVTKVEKLVTVGDYCTSEALSASRQPEVAIIDLKVKREEDRRIEEHPMYNRSRIIDVENPSAHISARVWGVLQEALNSPQRVVVRVRGEEDLVALPAILLAPEGYVVAYGLPDRGAVLVEVDVRAKARVKQILTRMEVVDGD